jgi:subtilisin-like proprotein convertase family protein
MAVLACFPCAALATTITVTSPDAPQAIPESDLIGITSTLSGPSLLLTDVNLVINDLMHTSVSDLHIELAAPSGQRVVLMKAFTEGGILIHLGTPDNFIDTVFDDQASQNLRNGKAPYTGSFNLDHKSIGTDPLSGFDGLNAFGTWTLYISDRAAKDTGTLYSWSLQFTGTPVEPPNEVPEPGTLLLLGAGIALLAYRSPRRKQ